MLMWHSNHYFLHFKRVIWYFLISIPFVFFPVDDRITMKTYGFTIGIGLYFCNSPLAEKPSVIVYMHGVLLIASWLGCLIFIFLVSRFQRWIQKWENVSTIMDSFLLASFLLISASFLRNLSILFWDLWSSHSSLKAIITVQNIAVWIYYGAVVIFFTCITFYMYQKAKKFKLHSRLIYCAVFICIDVVFLINFHSQIKNDFITLTKKPHYYVYADGRGLLTSVEIIFR